jgi:hypothetical protein
MGVFKHLKQPQREQPDHPPAQYLPFGLDGGVIIT